MIGVTTTVGGRYCGKEVGMRRQTTKEVEVRCRGGEMAGGYVPCDQRRARLSDGVESWRRQRRGRLEKGKWVGCLR